MHIYSCCEQISIGQLCDGNIVQGGLGRLHSIIQSKKDLLTHTKPRNKRDTFSKKKKTNTLFQTHKSKLIQIDI